jgi:hypothetical protein
MHRSWPLMYARAITIASVILLRPTAIAIADRPAEENPFRFLEPTIQISGDDQSTMDQGGVLVRVLPASGHELAVLAGGSINVTPDDFIASVRDIAALKRSSLVPQIGRFSVEPRLEDLRELTLDDVDIDEIRRCRPDRCGLKLTPEEIGQLQRAAAGGESRDALQDGFRRAVLERTKTYLRNGDERTNQQFSTLLEHSPYLRSRMPTLIQHLERYPAMRINSVESFLYWTKEVYAWKPMISVTHVTIVRGGGEDSPEVVVASRDVFATRYTSASLTVSMMFRDSDSPRRYLVYINRTWVDAVRALWRPFVEHRIKGSAKKVFVGVRERIERQASANVSRR